MLVIVKGKFHPWMALVLAILAGTTVFVLLSREPGGTEPRVVPASRPAAPEVSAATPVSPTTSANPARSAGISPEELDRFRKNMRRTLLHSRYPWIASAAARELFLSGRIREAVALTERDLVARTSSGDRDAAVLLYGLRNDCDDPDFADLQRSLVERAPQMQVQLSAQARLLTPVTRAKALVAIDISREETEILASMCQGPSPIDMTDLKETVRRAAADGHTPSLEALASSAAWNRDDASRERYLLSASLLGDAEGQWRLAGLYGKRLAADPISKDRGKMRFWLEQAYDKVPAAAFELGECLLADCDGQPANPERARQLIESAARKGLPLAIDFMIHDTGGIDSSDKFASYAWIDFEARLADDGCDPDRFVSLVVFYDRRTRTRDSFYPNERAQAERRGKELYDLYGPGARAELGCN